MLRLTRSKNERIRIGDNIVVSILSVSGGRVEVGIDAPGESVLREELYVNNLLKKVRKNEKETVNEQDGRND